MPKPFIPYDPVNPMNNRFMEMLEKQQKYIEDQIKVQYISENNHNSCNKCKINHNKIFRKNDPNKPKLPIHPNCKCKYVDIVTSVLKVKNAPGLIGTEVNSREDVLKTLEKKYEKSSLGATLPKSAKNFSCLAKSLF